jgi:hypothetical protein
MLYLNLPKLNIANFHLPKDFDIQCLVPTNNSKKFNTDCLDQKIVSDLASIGLPIEFIVIFSKNPGYIGAIHRDVYYNETEDCWKDLFCGINFNLDQSTSILSWYNVTAKEILPPKKHKSLLRVEGVHYGVRANKDFKDRTEYVLIDKHYTTSMPVLVKTNIPHAVENPGPTYRFGVSIRFQGNPTFEECVEKLKNYY